jgi:hypothetical protein
MAPSWLTAIAWVYLGICFVCAGVIAYDIFVNHRRQPMGVMDAVFPITALYFGPFALALYFREGRAGAAPSASERPRWATMAIEVSHCGAGCTLGDLIAEWLIFALALTIAGYTLFAEYVGDYLLALAFGIVFQYFAIAPSRVSACPGPQHRGQRRTRGRPGHRGDLESVAFVEADIAWVRRLEEGRQAALVDDRQAVGEEPAAAAGALSVGLDREPG